MYITYTERESESERKREIYAYLISIFEFISTIVIVWGHSPVSFNERLSICEHPENALRTP